MHIEGAMLSPRTVLTSFYKAGVNTVRHDGFEHAGNLAFLGVLALFPFLVFVAALAGVVAQGQAGARFVELVLSELPADVVAGVRLHITEIISGPPQGLLTVAILGAIWTASSAVEGYRTILNRAYGVVSPPAYLWGRLLSVAQTLISSFAVVLAMMVLVFLPMAWEKVAAIFGKTGVTLTPHELVGISLLVIFAALAAVYHFLPNRKQSFVSVVPGAVLVTILWVGAARLLSIYLARFGQLDLIYGSLGGVIAALLFLYVNNIIFIYGAEFNALLKKAQDEGKDPGRPPSDAAFSAWPEQGGPE